MKCEHNKNMIERETAHVLLISFREVSTFAKVLKKRRGAKQDWLEKYDSHRTRTAMAMAISW